MDFKGAPSFVRLFPAEDERPEYLRECSQKGTWAFLKLRLHSALNCSLNWVSPLKQQNPISQCQSSSKMLPISPGRGAVFFSDLGHSQHLETDFKNSKHGCSLHIPKNKRIKWGTLSKAVLIWAWKADLPRLTTLCPVSIVSQPLPTQANLDNWHQGHHVSSRYIAPLTLLGSKVNKQQGWC